MSQDSLSKEFEEGVHTPLLGNSAGNIRVKELQRDQIMSRILSDKNNLAQINLMTLYQLEVKLALLERQLDSFEKIQMQLETLDETQFDQNHRNIFEDAYFAVKSQLLENVTALRANTNISETFLSSTRALQNSTPTPRINLPSLKLTTFNGNPRNWLDFYNLFCSLVHNNADLNAVSKFQYLRSCLVDPVKKLVESIDVTAENYEKALAILVSRYDNKFEIFQSHMQHMFEIQKIKQPNVSTLRDFIDSITANIRALETIASKSQIADGIILHMVVSKLDVNTQAKWEEESSTKLVGTSSTTLKIPTWEDLSAFLERRCKALNIINSNHSSQSNNNQTSNRLLVHKKPSSLVVSQQQTNCVICKTPTNHGAYRCTKFIEMNVQDRFAIVKHHKLCLNCLGHNHIASSCPSQNRCRHCNAAHNTLLHREKLTTPSDQTTSTKIICSTFSANNNQQDVPIIGKNSEALTLHVGQEKSLVILATALVQLCNEKGVSILGRALLDSCSQLNFVTKRMAQFLKPLNKKINTEISGLGNNSVSANYSCSIIVKSTTTAFIAPIDVVVIPSITSCHPQQQIDTSNWQFPANIKLADSKFHIPGPIDLLIGAAFFWDLLMVGRIKIENQPYFIKTKLGWVVTGSAVNSNSPQSSSSFLTSSSLALSSTVKAHNSTSSNLSQQTAVNTFVLSSPSSLQSSSVKARVLTTPSSSQATLVKAVELTPTDTQHTLSYLTSSSNSPQSSFVDIYSATTNKLSGSAKMTSHHKENVCPQIAPADHSGLACGKNKLNYKSFITISSEPLLESLLEKFWILEDCLANNKEKLSAEELQCEKYFYETTKRCTTTNKFIVRLPFKTEPAILGQSFETANRRFSYLESKFTRDGEIFTEYSKFMKEYLDLNHMAPAENSQEPRYFIPHHCVVKPDSTTTRLRVVFDASCRTSSGKSLNDILCVGPTLQDDIFCMLNRFRYHKYVLVADIAKMYRQVLVHDKDTRWQCILWRNEKSAPLGIYKLQTLTYGTSCAPYLAVKCLQQLAHDYSEIYPIGAKVTLNDFYVDNLMTGSSSVNEVIEIKRQVVELLQHGGFPLRKFASNNDIVLEGVPEEDKEDIVQLDNMHYIKTLGLRWSPNEDYLSFSYTPQQKGFKITKRTILAHTAAFFDPLGLINPIIVKAKILLQSLWRLKLHWDESVPQDVFSEWEHIRAQLNCLTNIKIPRFVSFNSFTNIHAFADASKKAYGACVYVVTKSVEGMTSSLICAKSRVAPAKEISLPRLELCAALLCVKLLKSVQNCFPPVPHTTFCWSDSTITLAWIAGESHGRPTFVANRITKIQQLSDQVQWRHVPSEQNPADLLSRGATVSSITDNDFWFEGPSFIKEDYTKWPPCITPTADSQELSITKTTLVAVKDTTSRDILESHKFINSYAKLLRMIVYIERFITLKCTLKINTGPITVEEINSALIACCRIVQSSCFSVEFKQIKDGRPMTNSKLIQLSPFLKDGVIRVGGRLKNSSLSFSAKHPMLLPSNHPFVKTLIIYHHRKHFHAGALALHNILREQFWIINGRNVIKQIIHSCILCYRYRPKTENQVMGSLPLERVEPALPFQICGVDYCGPFYITQKIRGRSPVKGYISLFICFSTKAVHMELVPDLTTISFIAALKRFIARRGRCSTIYSDNATNFIGANRELKALLENFLSDNHNTAVQEACQQDGISWKFIPPRSPHFGGLWESGVKQAKYYLRRAIGNYTLTYDELNTIVCQAEAIVNSRPLTPLSSDPNDLRPLTPAHFLIGRPLTALAEPNLCNVNPASLKSYKLIEWIQQHFWERWRKEYLNCLQQKTKWSIRRPNIEVNDLVLLKDDNIPPLKWSLARVVQVNPGDDGAVRVATVKSNEGVFKRAITKLCKLPLEQ